MKKMRAAPAVAARSVAADPRRRRASSSWQQLLDMTSESSEELTTERARTAAEAVDLEGRFMSVVIATPAKDGGYVLSCDTGESAVEHAKHAHDVRDRQGAQEC